MRILGIESTCDESAIAVIDVEDRSKVGKDFLYKDGLKVKKEVLIHLLATHNNHDYGGVIPESAARQHFYYLPNMLKKISETIDLNSIDLVCASYAPGLVGGLLLGTGLGKTLASSLSLKQKKEIPFIPIHHIEAHALSAMFEMNQIKFPFIACVLSGGHTLIILMEDFKKYKIISKTVDDAMGELFDKIAQTMGLGFPGGPIIEKLALEGDPKYKFPKPKIKKDWFNFSFSGLKTAIQTQINKIIEEKGVLSEQDKKDVSASLQRVVGDIVAERLEYIAQEYPHIKTWAIGGGVAANQYIRQEFQNMANAWDKDLFFPAMKLCTDNAIMIAWSGYIHKVFDVPSDLGCRVFGRMSCEDLKF